MHCCSKILKFVRQRNIGRNITHSEEKDTKTKKPSKIKFHLLTIKKYKKYIYITRQTRGCWQKKRLWKWYGKEIWNFFAQSHKVFPFLAAAADKLITFVTSSTIWGCEKSLFLSSLLAKLFWHKVGSEIISRWMGAKIF